MNQTGAPERRLRIWQMEAELPPEVFEAWHKPAGAISPVAIVATVDPDGTPRTAPFGSLRAITPRLLRLVSWRGHDTYANLVRDGRVSVALVCADVTASVTGRARIVRERSQHDDQFAILEIDVDQVKNDMAYRIVVESGIEIVAREQHKRWYEQAMAELADLE